MNSISKIKVLECLFLKIKYKGNFKHMLAVWAYVQGCLGGRFR